MPFMKRQLYRLAASAVVLSLMALAACVHRAPSRPATPGFSGATAASLPSNMVMIVQGTASLSDPGDRGYARGLTLRISRWLRSMGIRHTVITDEQAAAGELQTARVAILPLNPNPPASELKALRRFAGGGGRLIVCYGTDRALAELMGIKLGVYRTTSELTSFTFNEQAPPQVPPRVKQRSSNIFSAAPADSSGKVVATWDGGHARRAPEPAWIRTPAGFWMTHVLLEDDAENKKKLCLALLGDLAPEIWAMSAAYWRQAANNLGPFPKILDVLCRRAGPRSREQADSAAAQARQTYAALTLALDSRRYPEAVAQGIKLQQILAVLYASVQDQAPDRFRGMWSQSGRGLYPGAWPRTCRELADGGFNAIISFVHAPGLAHYASGDTPRSQIFHTDGDQLRACCDAARAAGVKVHAWKICWNMEYAAPGFVQQLQRQGRLQVSDTGAPLSWLCPTHPDNREMEKNAILEIVRDYPIDGIQLDYIRYKDSHHCFCSGCRRAFEKMIGRRIRRWPADVRNGELAAPFRRWRADVISSFVAEAGKAVRAVRPGVALSAAVYGYYPRCIDSIGQDWGTWLANGYVDFLCPMNYTEDHALFLKWTRNALTLPGAAGRIFPGIGVTASESQLTPFQTIDQIQSARREGAAGFALYEFNDTTASGLLPLLKLGATAVADGKR